MPMTAIAYLGGVVSAKRGGGEKRTLWDVATCTDNAVAQGFHCVLGGNGVWVVVT